MSVPTRLRLPGGEPHGDTQPRQAIEDRHY